MRFNIPTLLTLFRVILIPFFVLAFYLPFSWAPFVCALIFFVAAVTDWFDGYLARRWNQSTRFGAFLDPVADKVMVAIAMVLVAEHYHTWWVTLPAATMIAREIIISALREWMAELGKRSSVAVSWIGKVKTTAQMAALVWMLWRPNVWVEWAGIVLFMVAAVLTLWSMLQYLNAARGDLLEQ
ncbi:MULTISPECIES: CDP-diacylglycerol--glycerol-3-phosphate 3-phosphatidyltransferase [Klebsiella]|jgi:CDP-diacylglycerol--glycerol-3-phosphate 3-phosphatidyltransferase|uniref:CDP-diacylglycerol--glycerol-3-phosphate 3-phosphatidyltransferase n=2 Tax=Klebsiella aerogenes TaxID=548 RepID=A0AAJ5J7V6_KLEAE|nr:CDP-diacylglycerol--glycerol-3-phosphate 3-phosphatidyltransferase [Klebsiella aerogenes]MCL6719000.1 CDP-diacylglycerol--glycerol-3-phosphate 3-phosphatidyltransferase [Klebsiella sp. T2.Ur]AKK79773.1 phosphatidylglycerophosphate synthetase [Klebsiella aerogenes]AMH08384.1 CDP-diacylglycerol--glycerol-3-phosphate 3-phosphatidyltransferase [Klebsiella aerogenes]AML34542.1 CDP-diacylglycerol--glycerol-3-phosphate 3-phosphatidyltransferase [Klebsiella aerogenes]AMQ58292.1 CDP-diacylglycerol--